MRSSWGRRPCAATTRRSPCATKRSAGSVFAANRPADPAKVTLSRSLRLAPRVELLHRRLGRTDRLHRQRCRIAARNSGRNRPYPRPFGGADPHRTGKAGLRTAARRGRPPRTLGLFLRRGSSTRSAWPSIRRPRRRPARPSFRTAFRSGTLPQQRRRLEGMEVTTYTLHPDRTEEDLHYLRQAIALSRRCTPCATSYRVGAVIVTRSGDRFTGYTHETSPTHHAEQEAILKATAAGADLHGASIYSSMEPCSTQQRTGELFGTDSAPRLLAHGFCSIRTDRASYAAKERCGCARAASRCASIRSWQAKYARSTATSVSTNREKSGLNGLKMSFFILTKTHLKRIISIFATS